jgi:SPP1 gp7 family putative phage head morphogenesis protein
VITQSVRDRDAFGLGQPEIIGRNVEALGPDDLAGLSQAEKVQAFNEWLEQQEAAGILQRVPGPGGTTRGWSDQYITSSYQAGLRKSTQDFAAKGIEVPATIIAGTAGIGGVFLTPFHQERVQILWTETFTALENVTAATNEQIRRIIAQGMAEGIGPEEIARRINNRVDKIGVTRAKTVARTQVVKTYNVAQVMEYQRIETIIGEEVFVQWWTAEDERVRASHRERHDKIYTKEEYLTLIGEPNCRCTGLPYVMSVDGEAEVDSAAATRAREAEQVAKEKAEAAERREERRRQRAA